MLGDSDSDCFCALSSYQHARTRGLNVVFPIAVCLVRLRELAAGYSLIREVQSYVDELGVPYQCLSNDTFMSNLCCGSRDGMVYVPAC